jgi:mannose-6-phosphate isomerase-like protein (cupin superfamily)
MERREFMLSAGLFAALGILPNIANAAPSSDCYTPLEPFLLPPAPPLSHNGRMDIKVWVRSHMTGGVFSSVECAVAPKVMGPPPHFHKELDELMFVLEGTASVMVEGQEVQVPAGGWHFRPRDLRHTFWNASDQPLRFVDMYFNQPFEEFLERIFHELTPENGYQPDSDKLRKERDKLNEKFGLVYPPTAFEERQAIVTKYGLR